MMCRVGGVLGFMSKYAGPSVYEASREIVLGLVTEHLNIVCVIPEEDELKSVEQVSKGKAKCCLMNMTQ